MESLKEIKIWPFSCKVHESATDRESIRDFSQFSLRDFPYFFMGIPCYTKRKSYEMRCNNKKVLFSPRFSLNDGKSRIKSLLSLSTTLNLLPVILWCLGDTNPCIWIFFYWLQSWMENGGERTDIISDNNDLSLLLSCSWFSPGTITGDKRRNKSRE